MSPWPAAHTRSLCRGRRRPGAIASSTCSCRTVAVRPRTVMISRRCSHFCRETEFTFRGQTQTVRAGSTVNIPANAPHAFKNMSGKTARMLCLCAPAGQEELFLAIGFPVDSRTAPAPKVSPEAQAEKGKLLATLAPKYRTEILAR